MGLNRWIRGIYFRNFTFILGCGILVYFILNPNPLDIKATALLKRTMRVGYDSKQTPAPNQQTTTTKQAIPHNSVANLYLGCWSRQLEKETYVKNVAECIKYCQSKKRPYAGIRSATFCRCCKTLGDVPEPRSCTSDCFDDHRGRCGGPATLSMYATGESYSKLSAQARKVLVLSYWRSGTTFVSKIYGMHPYSIYIFEPYWNLELRPNTNPSVIKDLLTCNLSVLPPVVLVNQWKWARRYDAQKSLMPFYKCMNTKPYIRCVSLVKIACEKATLRVVKVIRVAMRDAVKILKDLPDMKIVHVVRDPRGTHESRKPIDKKYQNTNTSNLCKDIVDDYESSANLPKNVIMRLNYETAAEQPVATAINLYKFINFTLHKNVLSWVERSTGIKLNCEKEGKSKKQTYKKKSFQDSRCSFVPSRYGTNRKNASESAYLWKKTIHFDTVKFIDSECRETYARFGYLPINTAMELRDSLIRHRIINAN